MGFEQTVSEDYKQLPIAFSTAKIIDSRIYHDYISEQFCKDYNISEDVCLNNFNSRNENYPFYVDLFWINELENQIINNNIESTNIIVRFKGYDCFIFINIDIKKDNEHLLYIYTKLSNNTLLEDKYNEIITQQQINIADSSKESIAIVSKQDLSILYLNKVAKKRFKNVDYLTQKLKCNQLFDEFDICDPNCPILKGQKDNIYCFENNQRNLKIVFVEFKQLEKNYYSILHEKSLIADFFLRSIFNAFVEAEKKAYVELMSIFCFDIETKRLVLDYQVPHNFELNNMKVEEVFSFFYQNILYEEEKEKFWNFFNFDNMVKNLDENSARRSIEYHISFNGNTKVVKVSYNSFLNPENRKEYLLVNAYDISDRIESNMMLNAMISYQNELVARQDEKTRTMIIYSREGNFLKFPVGFSRYSYDAFERHVHKNLNVVENYGDKRTTTCDERALIKKDETYSTTYVVKINDEILYKRNIGFRDDDNNLFWVVYDVTDLAKSDNERNDRLKRINKQLSFAKQEAVKANEEKSEFLSRMSHDMRTPLGAIINLSNFGIEECKDSYFRNFYKQINESGEYLLSLVKDILDFQKIENNAVHLDNKVILFGETSNSIYNLVKPKAIEKNITLNFTKYKSVHNQYLIVDEKRMKQILVNILTNAIKYTPKNGQIDWNLLIKKDKDGNIFSVHTITDNGVGMSKDFQKRMFQPFVKEKNELSEIEGGTGLGLAISKKLLDSMGGTITCESDLGKGTKFTITIPRKIPNEEQIENYFKDLRLSNKDIDFEGKSILACEDVKINQVIIEKLLLDKNASITIVNNGLEGVAIFKKYPNKFDAILMDIKMPKLNGLEATKEIRKINKDIPIIALSANAFSDDIKRSLDVGMNAHIAKPIKKDELYFLLKKFLVNNKIH